MLLALVLAIPMAMVWLVITSSLTLGSFAVGYLLSLAILLVVRYENVQINTRKLPDQALAFILYVATLLRDIWLSSVDVAKRVLDPKLPMKPGILRVATQDADHSDFTTAFSAHGITITPGELVVDFDGTEAMYVHCLDVENSANNSDGAQSKRLKLLRRILGKD